MLLLLIILRGLLCIKVLNRVDHVPLIQCGGGVGQILAELQDFRNHHRLCCCDSPCCVATPRGRARHPPVLLPLIIMALRDGLLDHHVQQLAHVVVLGEEGDEGFDDGLVDTQIFDGLAVMACCRLFLHPQRLLELLHLLLTRLHGLGEALVVQEDCGAHIADPGGEGGGGGGEGWGIITPTAAAVVVAGCCIMMGRGWDCCGAVGAATWWGVTCTGVGSV